MILIRGAVYWRLALMPWSIAGASPQLTFPRLVTIQQTAFFLFTANFPGHSNPFAPISVHQAVQNFPSCFRHDDFLPLPENITIRIELVFGVSQDRASTFQGIAASPSESIRRSYAQTVAPIDTLRRPCVSLLASHVITKGDACGP